MGLCCGYDHFQCFHTKMSSLLLHLIWSITQFPIWHSPMRQSAHNIPLILLTYPWPSHCSTSAAGASWHFVVFCPHQSGVKSVLPFDSAICRRIVTALAAVGKGGADRAIGPTSRIKRLTMPRAGRPVKTLVSAVSAHALFDNAARCK